MMHDRGAVPGLDMTSLRPVAFGTPDGVVVQAWRSRLPPWFAARLARDLRGLRQEAAEQAATSGAALVDFDTVTVAGRPALRRIERLPEGALPGVVYAGSLTVVHDGDVGVEIAVTCRDTDDTDDTDTDGAALSRTRRIVDEIASIIRFPETGGTGGTGSLREAAPDGAGRPRDAGR